MTVFTLKMNNRAYTIAILVCFLACLPAWIQAQDQARWEAGNILMSKDGQHLAVRYDAFVIKEDRRDERYDSGVWIYDLDDLFSPPRYLRGTNFSDTRMAISPDSRYISLAEYQDLEIYNIRDETLVLDIQRTAAEKPLDLSTMLYSPDSRSVMFLSDYWATQEHEMSIWEIDSGSHGPVYSRGTSWAVAAKAKAES